MKKNIVSTATMAVLVALAALGGYLVYTLISGTVELIVTAVLVALAVLWLVNRRWARVPLVPLVSLLVLLAVDYGWAKAFSGHHPAPVIGLYIAGFVVAGAATVYLVTPLAGRHPPRRLWPWLAVTVVLIVVAPPVAAWAFALNDKKDTPPKAQPAIAQLDAVVVSSDDSAMSLPPAVTTRGWNIRYFAGRADGDRVTWRDGAPPQLSPDADHVLLLVVDGMPRSLTLAAGGAADRPPEPGEVGRWLRIADAAAPRGVPTFALLQTPDADRLDRWGAALTPADEEHPDRRRHGGVRVVQGPADVGDLAVALGVTAPGADEDLALAARHRPVLLFDRKERYVTPLNVDDLVKSGELQRCPDKQIVGACTVVHGSGDLESGANHLAFDTRKIEKLTAETTIYVNVTHHRVGGRDLAYLDYWWYLPDNPAGAAGGALCGAGFVIAEVTCFDHQSDWEGLTVVVDPASPSPEPVEVHYSAHAFRTRYTWAALKGIWSAPAYGRFLPPKGEPIVRPLDFVARGTHAAYPDLCRRDCVEPDPDLREQHHDGARPWAGNDDVVCATICVGALPTHRARSGRGRAPALWNAYAGAWGTPECFAFLCTSSNPPKAPGQQGRYRKPWCFNTEGTMRGRRIVVRTVPVAQRPAGCG